MGAKDLEGTQRGQKGIEKLGTVGKGGNRR